MESRRPKWQIGHGRVPTKGYFLSLFDQTWRSELHEGETTARRGLRWANKEPPLEAGQWKANWDLSVQYFTKHILLRQFEDFYWYGSRIYDNADLWRTIHPATLSPSVQLICGLVHAGNWEQPFYSFRIWPTNIVTGCCCGQWLGLHSHIPN